MAATFKQHYIPNKIREMVDISSKGKNPIYNNLSTDEQLLIAAWAYGLKSGDKIHRFSLYTFIQSHLANKSEENLQKSLETDTKNWEAQGKGSYMLTEIGHRQINRYGNPNLTISPGSKFIFGRKIGSYTISVTVDPNNRKYIVKLNGVISKPELIIEIIENSTDDKITISQTSLPRKIMNWIINRNDYQWAIE